MVEKRERIDFKGMSLNGQELPFVYVDSDFIWKNDDPAFQHVISRLEQQPKPGFFLTRSEQGDGTIRVRWIQNRHGIFGDERFKDDNSHSYRDVDAKGIGYSREYPMIALPVMPPHMSRDREARGILEQAVAIKDRLISEELHDLGIRVARHVANIELYELVLNKKEGGTIVHRNVVGDKIGYNFDSIKPTIAIRAMGTSARVQELPSKTFKYMDYMDYAKEIIDDAAGLVSLELDSDLSPRDYAMWFANTLSEQLGMMHRNKVISDFQNQIHQGLHNVTLDCRVLDTYHYTTPLSLEREKEGAMRGCSSTDELFQLYVKEEKETWRKVGRELSQKEAEEGARSRLNMFFECYDESDKSFIQRRIQRMVNNIYNAFDFLIKDHNEGVGIIYPDAIVPRETLKTEFIKGYNKGRGENRLDKELLDNIVG